MYVLGDQITATTLIPAQAITATANQTGIDTAQHTGEVAFIVNAAAGTGTSPTLDVKIQDSADNTTFADLSPALAITQVTNAASLQKLVIDKRSLRRYVRAVCTVGGTTPSFAVAGEYLAAKQVLA